MSIFFALRRDKTADDPLIACKLDIPAKQQIGGPYSRGKPIRAEQKESKGLPNVVVRGNMLLLVRQHIFHLAGGHVIGQIDARMKEAEQKRGGYCLGLIDVFPEQRRRRDAALKAQKGNEPIEQKKACAAKIEDAGDKNRRRRAANGAGSRTALRK